MARNTTPKRSPKPAEKTVTFVVEAPDAREVIVTGDFTKWALDRILLSRAEDGRWRGSTALPPGEYQYRLLVDGDWRDHPDSPRRVPNGFGSENCVLTVT